jgi:signal transduction histidine kinase
MRVAAGAPKTKVQAGRVAATATPKRNVREPEKPLVGSLEQQKAISEILRVMSGSPGDVKPVLDVVAERAAHLCEAPFARVSLVDGDVLRAVAAYSIDGTLQASTVPIPLKRSTIAGRAVVDRKLVHHADVVPLLETEYPDAVNARRLGLRAVLGVPLIRDGGAYGVIFLFRREPRAFSPEQVALVETFARQAAIAIDHARLFKETKEALEQQTATAEILRVISESPRDVQPVFDAIVRSAKRVFGALTAVATRVVGDSLHLAAFSATDPDGEEALKRIYPMPIPGTLVEEAARTGQIVALNDVLTDPRARPAMRKVAQARGFRSLLVAPMLREGLAIGTINITRAEPGGFSDRQQALIKTFADQAVIAIENVRLFREIQDKSAQLELASQHKSEFLANMSHELRTPLNAIIGFSEVLSERMFGDINEKQAEYISDILQSGQHLLSLINDILDLSKIEAGRMELEVSDFDLPGTIEATLILVRERAVRRGIALERSVDKRLGTIRADERKVKQVLLNLLSNALKFTPEGGKIAVQAAVNDGIAEISVMDTGVGIALEDQATVFEEFRQVGTAAKKVEGTGLGLAISRKFIELHGGRIWVKSTVGSGSTFAFTLPLATLGSS